MAKLLVPLALLAIVGCAAVPRAQAPTPTASKPGWSRERMVARREALRARHVDWEKEVSALRDVVEKEKGVLDDVSRRLDSLQRAISQQRQHDPPVPASGPM